MSDHIAAVRAQAKVEIERRFTGPFIGKEAMIQDFSAGATWLASRLTWKKIAIALAKQKARDWDDMPGELHIAAIHAEYPNADAILTLLGRNDGE